MKEKESLARGLVGPLSVLHRKVVSRGCLPCADFFFPLSVLSKAAEMGQPGTGSFENSTVVLRTCSVAGTFSSFGKIRVTS